MNAKCFKFFKLHHIDFILKKIILFYVVCKYIVCNFMSYLPFLLNLLVVLQYIHNL
jgi:hypothetical protein